MAKITDCICPPRENQTWCPTHGRVSGTVAEWVDADVKLAKELLQEVVLMHSDPSVSEYNECDKTPCEWCVQAKMLIASTALISRTGETHD
jgi:hypothetical protein